MISSLAQTVRSGGKRKGMLLGGPEFEHGSKMELRF